MKNTELNKKLAVRLRDLKLERFLGKLNKYEAIIIDDIGYVQQSREEMERDPGRFS